MAKKYNRWVPKTNTLIRVKYNGRYWTMRQLADHLGRNRLDLYKCWDSWSRPATIREYHLTRRAKKRQSKPKSVLVENPRTGKYGGKETTIIGVGVFKSQRAAAEAIGVSQTTIHLRVRESGDVLTMDQIATDGSQAARHTAYKQQLDKGGTDEWLALGDEERV